MLNIKSANELLLEELEYQMKQLGKETPQDEYLVVEQNGVYVNSYDFKNHNLAKFYGSDAQNTDKPATVMCHPSQINVRITRIKKEDIKAKKIGFKVSE